MSLQDKILNRKLKKKEKQKLKIIEERKSNINDDERDDIEMSSTDEVNQGIKRKYEESLKEDSEMSNKSLKKKKKSKFHSLLIFIFIFFLNLGMRNFCILYYILEKTKCDPIETSGQEIVDSLTIEDNKTVDSQRNTSTTKEITEAFFHENSF